MLNGSTKAARSHLRHKSSMLRRVKTTPSLFPRDDKGSPTIVSDDGSKKAIHVLFGDFEFGNDGLHLASRLTNLLLHENTDALGLVLESGLLEIDIFSAFWSGVIGSPLMLFGRIFSQRITRAASAALILLKKATLDEISDVAQSRIR
jgi:hypothetical protein